jgi:hypothetical protein
MRGRLGLGWVAGLGVAATVLTGLGEALYFHLAFGVAMARVLSADFSLQTGVRPAVVVLGFSLIVLIAGLARERLAPPPRGRARFA